MITRRGWESLLAALAALLLSLYLLHYLLILIALVAFAFLATEVVLFHLDTLSLSPEAFTTERRSTSRRHAVGTPGRTEVTVRYVGDSGSSPSSSTPYPTGSPSSGACLGWADGARRRALGDHGVPCPGPGGATCSDRRTCGSAAASVSRSGGSPFRPRVRSRSSPENPVRKPGSLRRRIFTRVQGRMQLRHRGYGTEFRALRPYQFSDDIRHVAWRRSTAKQLIVREFDQESRQDVLLVVDVSPAMLAGPPGENVLDRACEAATMIAGYAQRSGEDRLGLLTYSGRVHQFLRPARGPMHFRRLYENVGILGIRPGTFDVGPTLDAVAARLRHGAHVLLFSTLDRPLGGLERAYAHFKARGHHLYVFLPDLSTFYGPGEDPAFQHALDWAAEEDRARLAPRARGAARRCDPDVRVRPARGRHEGHQRLRPDASVGGRMKRSDLRAFLIAPVFAFTAAIGFDRFGGWDPVVLLVTIAMAIPLLELATPGSRGRWFVPAWVLAMIAGVGMAFSNGAPTGVWADVGAGVLLGAPMAILAGLLVWRNSRLVTLLGVEAGLAALIDLFATSSAAIGSGGSTGSVGWLIAFSRVNTQQVTVLGEWVTGNLPSTPSPLAAVSDPIFIGLGVLAALAVVIALLERPIHAGVGPGPWDPHFSRSSGVVPLVVAMFAGLAFEWTAAVQPRYALFVVAVGVVDALSLIGILVAYTALRKDRPVAHRSPRAAAAEVEPTAGSAPDLA